MNARAPSGQFTIVRPAIERFAEKCRHDPATGCVLWMGGRTRGRGNSAEYGSFWFEGSRWFAHRWSGVHIHKLDLTGKQAGHCCPHGPDTLCVEHVTGQTQRENLAEMHDRRQATQSAADRQYWLLVERGYEKLPEPAPAPTGLVPFYEPPLWLRPYLKPTEEISCPF